MASARCFPAPRRPSNSFLLPPADDLQQSNKILYFDRKTGNSKTYKPQMMSPSRHDYPPYWTGTDCGNYKQKSRRANDSTLSRAHVEMMQNQQSMPNYPSSKKKMMQYAQAAANAPPHISQNARDALDGGDFSHRLSWIGGGNAAGFNHPKQMPMHMAAVAGHPHNSYAIEEPVYEEIMSNRMSDMDDEGDDMNLYRNRRLGCKNREDCDADEYEDGDDEVDRLCLNHDNDDLMQPNFRKPPNPSGYAPAAGSAGFNDAIMQSNFNR